MKLPARKKRKGLTLGLSFAIPFVGMLIVMAADRSSPFGPYSMLYSDMYYQYYPFFVAFRGALREGKGLLWTWSVGMGMDYLGLISYYLASPLNLLGVLVPEGLTLQYFSLMMPIKLGFAGLFFAVFLKKIFQKDDPAIPLFAGFYGLCAWALGYQWNVMWLDTFALLPLVALGTVSLLRDKRFALYTVTLFLSVFINYYIGLFTCIFVFLSFFCYELCRWRGFKRFFADLIRIAVFSVLAIGMTAILELPALAALQTTYSSVNAFPKGYDLNITDKTAWKGLFDAMRQVAGNMGGGLEPTFKEGLPNLYCGVGTIMLGFLYLTSGEVKLRDKLCSVLLLLFFMVSFIVRKLDYIWHGFHFTNMIPYRFSFLFSFVLLYMAYRAYLMRERFHIWQIAVSLLLAELVLSCSDHRQETVFMVYNLAFLGLYTVTLLLGLPRRKRPPEPVPETGSVPEPESAPMTQPESLPEPAPEMSAPEPEPVPEPPNAPETQPVPELMPEPAPEPGSIPAPEPVPPRRRISLQKAAAVMLLVVLGLETVTNLVNFGCWFPLTDASNYPRGKNDAVAVVRTMKAREHDTLFYRAETTHYQSLNDGALNGYNGVTTFTSSANVRTTEFMQALGYGARNNYNRYYFEDASPVGNLFLGLKYMIERDGSVRDSNFFDPVLTRGNVTLLENKAYLPLGFMTQTALGELEFTLDGDPFVFQNNLIKAATGLSRGVWQAIPTGNLSITATEGIELDGRPESRWCSYSGAGSVSFTYTADRAGFMCVHLNLYARNNYQIFKNGAQVVYETYSLPLMCAVGEVEPGDEIEIKMHCNAGSSGTMLIRADILDEQQFAAAYHILSASTLELTRFESTLVEGIIDCGQNGLLYTSIPQDGNWLAYVDGVPTEPVLVGECMIGLTLFEGTHTVTFRYRNAAFELGWKVSLVCAVLFLLAAALRYRPGAARRRGKHEKRK